MANWKNPSRISWHEVVCSRCRRVIIRLKLPGLVRERSERLCPQCAAAGAGRPQPSRARSGSGQERRGRGPRRSQESAPTSR